MTAKGTRRPIESQPGGTGKLYSASSQGFYEGEYRYPGGKSKRRKFYTNDWIEAKRSYLAWCAELDAELSEMVAEKENRDRKARQQRNAAPEAPAAGGADAGGKETSMADNKDDAKNDETGEIYVVQVVGGAAIAWCETFDRAAQVCDALTVAAKASGFAAKYDVVEVKRWTA